MPLRNMHYTDLTLLPKVYDTGNALISRRAGPLLPAAGSVRSVDAAELFNYWGWSAAASFRYLATKPGLVDVCNRLEGTPERVNYWVMAKAHGAQRTPKLVGHVSLHTIDAESELKFLPAACGMATIGITVFRAHRGQGWGSYMAKAAATLALDNGLSAVCAETRWDNAPSAHALRSAGLTEIGAGSVSTTDGPTLGADVARRFMKLANGCSAINADWPFIPQHRGWLLTCQIGP